jgi:hypothetical protein
MICRRYIAFIILCWLILWGAESVEWVGESYKIAKNQLPIVISFDPTLDSPQQIGMPIGWQVTASDPDNDTIYYKFWVNGPKTGGAWQILQDWSPANTCYWRTDEKDVGQSDVRVWIRDGKHAGAEDKDASREYLGYKITQEPDKLNVEVTSDVYSEKDRSVYYCPKGNMMVIKNRIFLMGSDIDKVTQVRYFLHESLNQPEGVLGDPNNGFEIWIWTWGGFPIKSVITTNTGQEIENHYIFSFKNKYDESQMKGVPLVEACGE